jgi:hypothetical protein
LNRLKYSRAILDAIHSGELAKAEYEVYGTFNLHVPTSVSGVPSDLLNPQKSWRTGEADFNKEVTKLAKLFLENFKKYEGEATPDVINAGELCLEYTCRDLQTNLPRQLQLSQAIEEGQTTPLNPESGDLSLAVKG